jgi:hypothetical protein
MSNIHLGVALGRTILHAAGRGARGSAAESWSRMLAPMLGGAAEWPELKDALRELREDFGVSAGREATLSVALMPELVAVRPLELPPLRSEEVRRLLQRNSGRYFPGASEMQIVAATFTGIPNTVLGAAASARLVEAVLRAAREAGWTLRALVPAHAVWPRAAAAIWPSARAGAASVIVGFSDRIELLRLARGRVVDVRRFRAGSVGEEHVTEAIVGGAGSSRGSASVVAFLGPDGMRRNLSQRLGARGVSLLQPSARDAGIAANPGVAAAIHSLPVTTLELLPESVLVERQVAVRGLIRTLSIAAVALLLVAAALELWGQKRELREIQAQRAAIREGVTRIADARARISETEDRIAALRPAGSGAQWSVVIAEVARYLPRDAHLLAFRARGDSVIVEGSSSRATGVFTSLQRAPGLAGVSAAAPIRRDLSVDGDGMERFTLSASVAPPPETTP